ncbi:MULTISPECIES: fimbrial protein [Acinetobacter]|uniref:fimbrial protein n=1 Tax=Acinetobacter TaxID=469 RepID=UPI0015D3F763|nr:fimbrial protein [Acinetobacter sp. YH12208]
MFKQLLGLIVILLYCSKVYSLCGTDINPVNFTATMASALSDNSYHQLSSQAVRVSSPEPISGCSFSGSSVFKMAPNTDLLTSSTITKGEYTYYQIPASFITPLPTFNVYMAFSVKDNQDNAEEHWVNDATRAYTIFEGRSSTRGIRLENVRLLVSGIGNAQSTFVINNLRLGQLTALSGIAQSASTIIRLSNSTFKITKTTCVVNSGAAINVTLPTVRTTDFTSIGQTLGDTTFTVNVSGCNAIDANKSLVALLTDNNNAASNTLGLLKNTGTNYSPNVSVQITDSSGSPLPIAPKVIGSSSSFFNFGTIGTGGTVSKSFKARYYSNAIPVPATGVYAQATITLIYN